MDQEPVLTDHDISREDAIAELVAIELEVSIRRCKKFKHFIHEAWEIVEPSSKLVWNWHLDEFCHEFEHAARTPDYRGIFNVPPATMKSLLMVFGRAWLWTQSPSLGFLSGSYSLHLSLRDNVKLRQIVQSVWYQARWPRVRLVGDQNAKELFKNSAGGWSFATSVGGAGTGEHPDFIFIDDPISAQEARSDVAMASANEWIDRTLSTRGMTRGVRFLLTMQRLNVEDPSGHLLAKGGWNHMCFPMEYRTYEEDPNTKRVLWRPDWRDKRIVPGELLWPALIPRAKVEQLKIDLGPYGAAGQLGQQPSPEGGGLFKRSYFSVVDVAPLEARRVRGWDTAGTESDGDYTVGVKMAQTKDGIIYIEDVVRGQLGPDDVEMTILNTAKVDGKKVAQREEKEGGSAGKGIIASHLKLLKGYDYEGVTVGTDKITRAKPFRAQCAGGNVRLIRGEWNEAYLQELEHFPVGKHDDQIDASSCAYNQLVIEEPKKTSATWGR